MSEDEREALSKDLGPNNKVTINYELVCWIRLISDPLPETDPDKDPGSKKLWTIVIKISQNDENIIFLIKIYFF